jgi:hypothetical protein
VWVQATELNDDESGWTEAAITIERDGGDEELRDQELYLTPAEFEAVYQAMWLQRNEGTWSHRAVTES